MSTGLDTSRVDEEGTPDVYRNLINKLQRQNTIDEKIEEPLSPDWRAESEILPHLLQELRDNEQWKPRQGEIVLFVRSLPEDQNIARVESKGEYQLYDNTSEKFLGPPLWEAGLVAQTPTKAICYNLGAIMDPPLNILLFRSTLSIMITFTSSSLTGMERLLAGQLSSVTVILSGVNPSNSRKLDRLKPPWF